MEFDHFEVLQLLPTSSETLVPYRRLSIGSRSGVSHDDIPFASSRLRRVCSQLVKRLGHTTGIIHVVRLTIHAKNQFTGII